MLPLNDMPSGAKFCDTLYIKYLQPAIQLHIYTYIMYALILTLVFIS
jgi:hypothetical protein